MALVKGKRAQIFRPLVDLPSYFQFSHFAFDLHDANCFINHHSTYQRRLLAAIMFMASTPIPTTDSFRTQDCDTSDVSISHSWLLSVLHRHLSLSGFQCFCSASW